MSGRAVLEARRHAFREGETVFGTVFGIEVHLFHVAGVSTATVEMQRRLNTFHAQHFEQTARFGPSVQSRCGASLVLWVLLPVSVPGRVRWVKTGAHNTLKG